MKCAPVDEVINAEVGSKRTEEGWMRAGSEPKVGYEPFSSGPQAFVWVKKVRKKICVKSAPWLI